MRRSSYRVNGDILDRTVNDGRFRRFGAVALTLLVSGSIVAQIHADSQPAFEVAVIKLNNSANTGWSFAPTPAAGGQFRAVNVPLKELVKRAFHVEDSALKAPAWLDSQRFDITAKAPSGVPLRPADTDEMLKSLLVERFHAKIHQVEEKARGYELVSGPHVNLQRSDLKLAGGRSRGPSLIAGHGMPMTELASALATAVGRPVVDATGLNGGFEVRLVWLSDDPQTAAAEARTGLDVSAMPSLFTAVREQLGLQLRPASVVTGTVIVDSIDRTPAEN